MSARALGALLVAAACLPPARAADDEIMVMDDDLAKVGRPELEIHNNFSLGSSQSPGARMFPPDRVLRVTPELSIGLAEHWDAGFYLPMSWVPGKGLNYDGVKARVKFIDGQDLAGGRVYYGAQAELADVQPGISPDRTSIELMAIGGYARDPWETFLNLIVQRDTPDADLISPGLGANLKITRDLGQDVQVGFEHYASWSDTAPERPKRQIDNLSFLTLQFKLHDWSLHLGVGHGWASSPDQTVFKLVLGVPLP